MNNRKKIKLKVPDKIIRIILIIFAASALVSVFIYLAYDYYQEATRMKDLSSAEKSNFRRYGRGMEDIVFCSYPEDFSEENMEIVESCGETGKFMKISLGSPGGKVIFGTRYCLTLDLRPYITDGRLVFSVKSNRSRLHLDGFQIFLKASEGDNLTNTLVYSLSLDIGEQWQKISIPFRDFVFLDNKNSRSTYLDFPGEIREALFVVKGRYPPDYELFIESPKIIEGENVIYEMF